MKVRGIWFAFPAAGFAPANGRDDQQMFWSCLRVGNGQPNEACIVKRCKGKPPGKRRCYVADSTENGFSASGRIRLHYRDLTHKSKIWWQILHISGTVPCTMTYWLV